MTFIYQIVYCTENSPSFWLFPTIRIYFNDEKSVKRGWTSHIPGRICAFVKRCLKQANIDIISARDDARLYIFQWLKCSPLNLLWILWSTLRKCKRFLNLKSHGKFPLAFIKLNTKKETEKFNRQQNLVSCRVLALGVRWQHKNISANTHKWPLECHLH